MRSGRGVRACASVDDADDVKRPSLAGRSTDQRSAPDAESMACTWPSMVHTTNWRQPCVRSPTIAGFGGVQSVKRERGTNTLVVRHEGRRCGRVGTHGGARGQDERQEHAERCGVGVVPWRCARGVSGGPQQCEHRGPHTHTHSQKKW